MLRGYAFSACVFIFLTKTCHHVIIQWTLQTTNRRPPNITHQIWPQKHPPISCCSQISRAAGKGNKKLDFKNYHQKRGMYGGKVLSVHILLIWPNSRACEVLIRRPSIHLFWSTKSFGFSFISVSLTKKKIAFFPVSMSWLNCVER